MRLIKWIMIIAGVTVFACDNNSSGENSLTGQGGSMTRFAILNSYLYVVDHAQLNVFDITGNTFQKIGEIAVNNGLETITARNEHLYLGANDGMYIYSLANPAAPDFVFWYSHIVSCDPVFVQGNRAYVTLRNVSSCNRGTNALEIIDITNPNNPTLVKNYQMTSPHGLAVDNNLLFLCEGDNGFKVFDISNEQELKLLTHLTTFKAYDVIARNGTVIITGEDGVFQYHYNETTGALELQSKIEVNRQEV